MSYILIVDDEPEILEILEMSLNMHTKMKVRTASSGNKAWELMLSEGRPLFIISDYRMPDGDGISLYKKVKEGMPELPFVVCSGNPLDELKEYFPEAFDYITKPQFFEPLKRIVNKLIAPLPQKKTEYVQVPVGFLLRLGVVAVDGFIKLSEDKYVKVHTKGDIFDQEDAVKLQRKLLNHLYVSHDDALTMARNFEEFLVKKLLSEAASSTSMKTAEDILSTTLAFSRALGWNEDTVRLAKQAVDLTIKMVSKDTSWGKVLKDLNRDNHYCSHITLQSLLVCVVAQGIGWSSEATKQKLVMAALLHDHFVDEKTYDTLYSGGLEASEVLQSQLYRQHPVKAAELARTLKSMPSDVDHILLQHHERSDGSGFPRGLTGPHISPLAAVFIICEELINFSHKKEISAELVQNFWEAYPYLSEKEPFRKIAMSMKQKVTA